MFEVCTNDDVEIQIEDRYEREAFYSRKIYIKYIGCNFQTPQLLTCVVTATVTNYLNLPNNLPDKACPGDMDRPLELAWLSLLILVAYRIS